MSDGRGNVFEAALILKKQPLTRESIRPHLLKRPAMAGFILAGIYWQALRIWLKHIPYVPYTKEPT